jgi:hypothetical protein
MNFNMAYAGYETDLLGHVGFVLNSEQNSYSLLYSFVGGLTNFFLIFNKLNVPNKETFVIGIMIMTITASVFASFLVVRNYFRSSFAKVSIIKIDFALFCIFIMSMLIFDFRISSNHYLGVFTPNPYHNPTFIFAKPFAIVLFILIGKVLEKKINNINAITYIAIAIFSILSMWSKPSFLISFLPTVLLFSSILYLRKEVSLNKVLIFIILVITCLVPLFIINQKVYGNSSSDSQITISFASAWSYHSKNIPKSIIMASCFPLFIYLSSLYVSIKNKISVFGTIHKLSILNFLFGVFLFLFLFEDGPRAAHANFGWTYMFSLFFLNFAAIELFLFKKVLKSFSILRNIGYLLLFLHMISGVFYFAKVFFGHNYF